MCIVGCHLLQVFNNELFAQYAHDLKKYVEECESALIPPPIAEFAPHVANAMQANTSAIASGLSSLSGKMDVHAKVRLKTLIAIPYLLIAFPTINPKNPYYCILPFFVVLCHLAGCCSTL
jgi:hypothetical protein